MVASFRPANVRSRPKSTLHATGVVLDHAGRDSDRRSTLGYIADHHRVGSDDSVRAYFDSVDDGHSRVHVCAFPDGDAQASDYLWVHLTTCLQHIMMMMIEMDVGVGDGAQLDFKPAADARTCVNPYAGSMIAE